MYIEMQGAAKSEYMHTEKSFDVTSHITLVTTFPENEVDNYFMNINMVAENSKWQRQHRTQLKLSRLIP